MKYDKIVRAGIVGCGNIFLEQILNYLFDQTNNELDKSHSEFYRPANPQDRVIHTFRYIDNLEPGNKCHVTGLDELHLGIIIPNRDFRSALASQMRKQCLLPTIDAIRQMYQNMFSVMYRERHKYTTIFPHQEDVLVLDYRKFFNNPNYIISILEQFLEIKITDEQQTVICKKFSIDVNRKIAQTMGSWNQMDADSGIHGMHIGTGHPESWKTFFPEKLHGFVTELMWTELIEYGWENAKTE